MTFQSTPSSRALNGFIRIVLTACISATLAFGAYLYKEHDRRIANLEQGQTEVIKLLHDVHGQISVLIKQHEDIQYYTPMSVKK